MNFTLYLPNKDGNHVVTKVPKYIQEILVRRVGSKDVPRIHCIGSYRYRIYGYNKIRKAYGLPKDMELLEKWVSRYFCEIEDVEFNTQRNNHYVDFTMYDCMAHQFEKAGLIRG